MDNTHGATEYPTRISTQAVDAEKDRSRTPARMDAHNEVVQAEENAYHAENSITPADPNDSYIGGEHTRDQAISDMARLGAAHQKAQLVRTLMERTPRRHDILNTVPNGKTRTEKRVVRRRRVPESQNLATLQGAQREYSSARR